MLLTASCIRRLLFFRTVRHSLRPNGARYGGTDGIEFRRHWLCVLYLRNTTDATLGSTGFSLSAREPEAPLGDPGFWFGVRRTKCTHIPRKNTTASEPSKHKSCASGSRPLVFNPNRTSDDDDARLPFLAANWRSTISGRTSGLVKVPLFF